MKRILLIVFAVFVVLTAAALIGGPYYAKNYIEENSKALVGRKIAMQRLHFNALNGHVLVTDFRLYEPDDTSHFVQFDTLFIDFAFYKLFSGHLWSDALHLKGMDVSMWMNGDLFNFSDLIPEEDSTAVDTTVEESFIKNYTFNDIQILHSSMFYEDRQLAVKHNMKDVNIKLPGISFGDEKAKAGLEFAFTDGGTFRTNLDYNQTTSDFVWEMAIDKLNLEPFTKYAQESLNIQKMTGWFSGDVLVRGNANTPETPIVSGSMNLNDFALTDLEGKEVVGFSSIFIDAKELNLATGKYHFGKLHINRPFINAVLTAKGDNLSALMKEEAEAVADTLIKKEQRLAEEAPLTYLLDEFRLNEGLLNVEDRALKSGVFKYTISQLNFAADNFTEGQMVTFDMDALLNGKGTFKGHVITDPGNPGNGTFDFYLKNTPIADFSPYCEDATGFPITGGLFNFETQNKIVNNHLNSHLVLNFYKTKMAKKRKDIQPDMDVPLKLGLAILEDNKGRINIDVPAEGNIDDPEFRYRKLIWKVVLNVLVKAATSPYNLLAKGLGVNEDELKFVAMDMLQDELGPEQTAQLDMLTQVLADKPELTITANPQVDVKKEAEALLPFLAKRGLYLKQNYGSDSAQVTLNAVDRAKILDIPEDEKLKRFLENATQTPPDSLKIQALMGLYSTPEQVEQAASRLRNFRRQALKNYLAQKPGMAERFILTEDWIDEGAANRPRFALQYGVKD
jgi:hypothetical protein